MKSDNSDVIITWEKHTKVGVFQKVRGDLPLLSASVCYRKSIIVINF